MTRSLSSTSALYISPVSGLKGDDAGGHREAMCISLQPNRGKKKSVT